MNSNNNKTLALIIGIVVVLIIGVIIVSLFNLLPGSMKKGKVTIHDKTFSVEIAQTNVQKEKGLSKRGSLSEDRGMLFLFDTADYLRFWMKDMKFPIDILFIKDDKIVTIYLNAQNPQSTEENLNPPLYTPTEPSNKVLELKAGTVEKYGIKQGDSVQISL